MGYKTSSNREIEAGGVNSGEGWLSEGAEWSPLGQGQVR